VVKYLLFAHLEKWRLLDIFEYVNKRIKKKKRRRKAKPIRKIHSFTISGKSLLIIASISKTSICPPSSPGIGRRLKNPS